MSIANFAIKHPTVMITIYVIITVLGFISISKLNFQNLPNITIPIFTVSTVDKGLSAKSIDKLVTLPIEKWFDGLDGLQEIVGVSYNNLSLIEIVCQMGVDANAVYLDIQKRMNKHASTLPKSASKSILAQRNIHGTPIIWIVFESKTLSLHELSELINLKFKTELNNIPGVGKLDVVGEVPRKIRVELDPLRMSSFGVPLAQIYNTFQKENVLLPGGEIEHHQQRYPLLLNLQLNSLDAIKSMIVAYRKNKPIYLSQIADVRLQQEPEINSAMYNNQAVIAVGILRAEETNVITVVESVKSTLKNIQKNIPHSVTVRTLLSEKEVIESGTNSLIQAMIFGLFFSMLVVFAFLGSLRLSLVVLLVVLVAMLAAITAVVYGNLSVNLLTLTSLIILICMVVDDTIIVIENYVYYLANRPTNLTVPLAVYSTDRIMFSIAAYTISLCIIFLSVLFSTGIIKVYFTIISMVIVPGVLISASACGSLAPLIFNKFMTKEIHPVRFTEILMKALTRTQNYYIVSVEYILKYPYPALILFFCVLLPIPYLLPELNVNLFPSNQNYNQIDIKIRILNNVPHAVFHQNLLDAIQKIRAHPDVDYTLALTRAYPPNQAEIIAKLVPLDKRKYLFSDIKQQLQSTLDKVPGFVSYVTPPPIFASAPSPMDFVIVGMDNSQLWTLKDRLIPLFDKHPNLGKIYSVGPPLQPVYKLTIDRYASAQMGLSAEEIAYAVALYGGEIHVGRTLITQEDQEYDIYLFPKKGKLVSPDDLRKIYLFNGHGDEINLLSVAKIVLSTEAGLFQSYNAQSSLEFYATPNISLSKAQTELNQLLSSELKAGQKLIFTGQAHQMGKMLHSLEIAIGVAVILLYFALAIQFDSFTLPIILLVSQPIAIAFVLYMLYLTNIGINLFSVLGLFLLIGIKTKNYILLITSMNGFYKTLKDSKQAALMACKERFRPIIMTTLVIIFTMLPTLFTNGPNSAKNMALSGTVLLGIITSTLFSLYFVPIAYYIFKGKPKQIIL